MRIGTHIGVTESEDRAGLILAFCHNELEVAVLILRDSQIGHRAYGRIELSQISAAYLAVDTLTIFMVGLCAREISASPDPE